MDDKTEIMKDLRDAVASGEYEKLRYCNTVYYGYDQFDQDS